MEPTGRGFFGPFDPDPQKGRKQDLTPLSLARLSLIGDKQGILDWLDHAFWSDERHATGSLPLIISIFRGRFDIADILASHGARLTAEETAVVQKYSPCEVTKLKAFLQHHHFDCSAVSGEKVTQAEKILQQELQKVFDSLRHDHKNQDQFLHEAHFPPSLLQIQKPSARDAAEFLRQHKHKLRADPATAIDRDRFLLRHGYFDSANFTAASLQKLADDYAQEPKAADLKRHFNLCACALRVQQQGIYTELRPQKIDVLMDAVADGRFLPNVTQTAQICDYLYRLYMCQAQPHIRDHVQIWMQNLKQSGAQTYATNPMRYLKGDDFSFAHLLLELNWVKASQFDIAFLMSSPATIKNDTNARLFLQLMLEKSMPERYADLRGMPDSFYTASMLKEYISNPDFVSQLALIKIMPPSNGREPFGPF